MLALTWTILKYATLFIVARLFGAAFGLELGISRQYLRLLELILNFGEKLIEKVQSKSKFHSHQSLAAADKATQVETDDLDGSGSNRETQNSEDDDDDDHTEADNKQLTNNGHRPNKLPAKRPTKLDLIEEDDDDATKTTQPLATPAKSRRLTSPDGPPIFLLDDSDLEEQAEMGKLEQDRINNNLNGFIMMRNHHHYYHKGFHLDDVCKFVQKAIAAIVDDEVTKRFNKEELKTWNLLTRTDAKNYQFMSKSLGFFWFIGLLFRYTCLFPLRVMFTIAGYIWLVLAVFFACMLPEKFNIRNRCYHITSMMAFRILSCGTTSKLQFHNRHYRPQKGDVCVANHTSPIDVLLLSCDNCYALVGQRHGGLIGILEGLLSRATNHVWFDRSEIKDRLLVTERLREHVKDRNNWPILIFPEGTCINNSAVMLFRKGSFEISDRVHPIAMKYDFRFGDAFWNSSKHSYVQYLLLLMSSWAIKCDVWYLPPMDRLPDETAAEFAGRVKAEIARQAGLKDLNWDGQLKRQATKERWKEQQQEDFANRLHLD